MPCMSIEVTRVCGDNRIDSFVCFSRSESQFRPVYFHCRKQEIPNLTLTGKFKAELSLSASGLLGDVV